MRMRWCFFFFMNNYYISLFDIYRRWYMMVVTDKIFWLILLCTITQSLTVDHHDHNQTSYSKIRSDFNYDNVVFIHVYSKGLSKFNNKICSRHNITEILLINQSINQSEWVSEWLMFSANSAIVQLHHGENKLIFNEMMMMSALY